MTDEIFMISVCPCGELDTITRRSMDGYYYIKCPKCGRKTDGHKDPHKAIEQWEKLCESESE